MTEFINYAKRLPIDTVDREDFSGMQISYNGRQYPLSHIPCSISEIKTYKERYYVMAAVPNSSFYLIKGRSDANGKCIYVSDFLMSNSRRVMLLTVLLKGKFFIYENVPVVLGPDESCCKPLVFSSDYVICDSNELDEKIKLFLNINYGVPLSELDF